MGSGQIWYIKRHQSSSDIGTSALWRATGGRIEVLLRRKLVHRGRERCAPDVHLLRRVQEHGRHGPRGLRAVIVCVWFVFSASDWENKALRHASGYLCDPTISVSKSAKEKEIERERELVGWREF